MSYDPGKYIFQGLFEEKSIQKRGCCTYISTVIRSYNTEREAYGVKKKGEEKAGWKNKTGEKNNANTYAI